MNWARRINRFGWRSNFHKSWIINLLNHLFGLFFSSFFNFIDISHAKRWISASRKAMKWYNQFLTNAKRSQKDSVRKIDREKLGNLRCHEPQNVFGKRMACTFVLSILLAWHDISKFQINNCLTLLPSWVITLGWSLTI